MKPKRPTKGHGRPLGSTGTAFHHDSLAQIERAHNELSSWARLERIRQGYANYLAAHPEMFPANYTPPN